MSHPSVEKSQASKSLQFESDEKLLELEEPSPVIRENSRAIRKILDDENYLQTMDLWNGIALFVEVEHTTPTMTYYHYNSIYFDSNNNKIYDDNDQGFFNPASTVKVGLAALALEKLNLLGFNKQAKYRETGTQTWYSISFDIEQTLIVSSNEAANRLILFLGFDNIAQMSNDKGLNEFSINRLMLDKGTLLTSPPFEILHENKITYLSEQPTFYPASCFEINRKVGNCASASDLIGVLARIVQPDFFPLGERFRINDKDLTWLQEILSKTPRDIGFNQEDHFCRFLHKLYDKKAFNKGKLLSKCGVALFSHSFVDTSFLKTDDGIKYYIVFSVTPPVTVSKAQAVAWINEVSEILLEKL